MLAYKRSFAHQLNRAVAASPEVKELRFMIFQSACAGERTSAAYIRVAPSASSIGRAAATASTRLPQGIGSARAPLRRVVRLIPAGS